MTTDLKDISELKKILLDHEERIKSLEKSFSSAPASSAPKELSIKEFINQKKPKDAVQTTLCICYFIEHHQKTALFNIKDIEAGFGAAKIPPPANINDKVNMNIRKGHMMPAKEKKDNRSAWVLTATGEQFIENSFLENNT